MTVVPAVQAGGPLECQRMVNEVPTVVAPGQKKLCLRSRSMTPFRTNALPTELPGSIAAQAGLEPATLGSNEVSVVCAPSTVNGERLRSEVSVPE